MSKRNQAGRFCVGFSPFFTCTLLWLGWQDWGVTLCCDILPLQKRFHSLNLTCPFRDGPWVSWMVELPHSDFHANVDKGRHPGVSFWRKTLLYWAEGWDCCGAWLSCKMERSDLGCFQCSGATTNCEDLTDASEASCRAFYF